MLCSSDVCRGPCSYSLKMRLGGDTVRPLIYTSQGVSRVTNMLLFPRSLPAFAFLHENGCLQVIDMGIRWTDMAAHARNSYRCDIQSTLSPGKRARIFARMAYVPGKVPRQEPAILEMVHPFRGQAPADHAFALSACTYGVSKYTANLALR
ncbi:hypothetical protein DAEQUDRAFT_132440 [Daedalea quercina L-15889]|uniref:Uncharacterized protein n=1 Tax=Daedalea quercina L-15889 TaxID=1314783 RepID=A0A165KPU0_9APHY|nr:hypothetical protein DAEQUDRAFT_132440 [Daedalea quercina L-15889]